MSTIGVIEHYIATYNKLPLWNASYFDSCSLVYTYILLEHIVGICVDRVILFNV